jgi:hypothetical protein
VGDDSQPDGVVDLVVQAVLGDAAADALCKSKGGRTCQPLVEGRWVRYALPLTGECNVLFITVSRPLYSLMSYRCSDEEAYLVLRLIGWPRLVIL